MRLQAANRSLKAVDAVGYSAQLLQLCQCLAHLRMQAIQRICFGLRFGLLLDRWRLCIACGCSSC